MRRYVVLLMLLAFAITTACVPRSRQRRGGNDDDDSAGPSDDDDDDASPEDIPAGYYTGDTFGELIVFGTPASCEGTTQLTVDGDGFASGTIACLDEENGVPCVVEVIEYDVRDADTVSVAYDCYPLMPGILTIDYLGDGYLDVSSEIDDTSNDFFISLSASPSLSD